MEVSVVIVCMDRPDYLYPCLESIRDHTSVSCEVWVVAYRFSEDNLSRLKADWPAVRIVESRDLRGFSENNNLALRQVTGKYCFIVNDDTFFSTPVIDALVADFDRLPGKVAALSPKICFPDGRVQTCGRGPWNAWRWMKHYLHLVDETRKTPWTMQEGLFRTYTLNGACFLIRTDRFREAGWFDETYTFTPEDIALGHRLNGLGYEVWADADVTLFHRAGGTVSRMETAIKPTRVAGALSFYGDTKIKRFMLACYVWFIEALRGLKYRFADRSDPKGRNAIMYGTARNVRRIVFDRRTPKEIFTEYFNALQG